MSLTRLWLSVDKAVRKMAEDANNRAEQAGIPDVEEKRLFYFQYIDKQIAKMKDDDENSVNLSRFKTMLKDRAAQLFEKTNLTLQYAVPAYEERIESIVVEAPLKPAVKRKKTSKSTETVKEAVV